MKRFWVSMIIALSATAFMFYQDGAFAQKPKDAKAPAAKEEKKADAKADKKADAKPAAAMTAPAMQPTIQIDKTSLSNGGTITVTGTAPAGKPVFIEVWAENKVRASRFDADVDKETGKRPYIFYMTGDMPAYYKIFVPKDQKENIDKNKKEGRKWSVSKALKDTGADAIYGATAKIKIDRYQATLMGSIIGSRGDQLPQMDDKENKKRSMQLLKARFRDIDKILGADVEVNPDGTYKAAVKIREGLAPGKYNIVAKVDKDTKSPAATFENNIAFPVIYLSNAGTSLNLLGPFFLTLGIVIFGVLMGAGGGFILNPLLVSIWPLPHTVVAGTVMPTVLFSQGSGIYNYSKIKFISWKLGVGIGLSMVAGGFIGPKLTELITLSQFKFVFGWILLILAVLMFWQTTPGYLEKNKKEQAILKEFKKRAEESAKAKG
ncbi:MAG: sulfite exporter TauE/SafE family protein, partial [Nitrospirae bacterium]|nr:sulfite exporter TauE/SafE family protein [Nitrospirota bacterium]